MCMRVSVYGGGGDRGSGEEGREQAPQAKVLAKFGILCALWDQGWRRLWSSAWKLLWHVTDKTSSTLHVMCRNWLH